MFQFDTLSLIFVALILLGTTPNLFYSFGYLPHIERKTHYQLHYFTFIFSMLGVVVAGNALVFLFFWELMSLTSWQLILTEVKDKETVKSARFYFLMTHFGFVFLLLFFLIVTNGNLDSSLVDMKNIATSFKYSTLLFFMLVFGFLSKAGAVVFHVWLPYAHPAAPSPVSALMSGVMLKVAIYGFACFLFDVLYPWPLEWGIVILVIGSISSLVVISLMLITPFYISWFDKTLVSLHHASVYTKMFPSGIWNMHSVAVHGGVVSRLILLGVTLLLFFGYKVLNVKTRTYHTWGCGYTTSAKTQCSATGFAGEIRRFFDWFYKSNEHFYREKNRAI